ncbi:hypothetical protein TRVL_08304 [Trypanosoma vivax]|nr:hypothetical protein TRVL_08304 [Trypanosoma vivax]
MHGSSTARLRLAVPCAWFSGPNRAAHSHGLQPLSTMRFRTARSGSSLRRAPLARWQLDGPSVKAVQATKQAWTAPHNASSQKKKLFLFRAYCLVTTPVLTLCPAVVPVSLLLGSSAHCSSFPPVCLLQPWPFAPPVCLLHRSCCELAACFP